MKKLLIAMTAAAVGTCAWAEGEQTLLSESFTGWTLTDNTWWSYSAEDADGELTLTEGEDAKLSLNTGSKVLTGSFTSDDQPKAIGNGLYFNAKVTFKDPSDTLPTLGEADKFALVVLDNAESIDAEKATAPATNLMVIAKYGDEAQRAYELNVAVDSTWLDGEHEIVVKAYDNVMKSGSTACAGFLVMVDKTVCKVVKSYAIVDGVVDFGTYCAGGGYFGDDGLGGNGNLGYLGYAKDAIAASIQLRYQNAELLLSNVPGSDTLASVDFQGQGVIDDVSLATTGADFGADALVFTVEVSDGVTLTSDETVYYGAAGETKNITFTLDEGYVLKAPTAAVKGDSGVYTYAYTTVADNNQVVNIEAYKPAAYIGGTAYETFADALAAAANGTVVLSDNLTLTEAVMIQDAVTIDLAGKTITAPEGLPAFFVNGTLTVVDSSNGAGKVDGAVVGNGEFNLQGGSFKNVYPFTAGEVEYPFPGADDSFTATLTDGYYVITAAANEKFEESKDLVDAGEGTLTPEQETAVEATFTAIAGEADDADAAVTNYFTTVYGANVKVPVATITGAKNVDISVKYNLPLMTAETPTVKITTEAAAEGDAAAFSFQIKDGDNAVAVAAAVEKVRSMIQYGAELNSMDTLADDNTDVVCSVDANAKKIKVQLKSGKNKGFMKVKLR